MTLATHEQNYGSGEKADYKDWIEGSSSCHRFSGLVWPNSSREFARITAFHEHSAPLEPGRLVARADSCIALKKSLDHELAIQR